jgi:hypothetical protein
MADATRVTLFLNPDIQAHRAFLGAGRALQSSYAASMLRKAGGCQLLRYRFGLVIATQLILYPSLGMLFCSEG